MTTITIPQEMLERWHAHVSELREAWQRGCIRETDGKGGTRSNRNVEVEVSMRSALSASGEPTFDIERLISECVPGGSVCDPQHVADAIRAYASRTMAPGWQMVPVEPTEEMAVAAVRRLFEQDMNREDWETALSGCYRAMLAAASKGSEEGG